MLWLYEAAEFNLDLKRGNNLISIPITINSSEIEKIFSNQNILLIKEYHGNSFLQSGTLQNNKGYFIECSNDVLISLSGKEKANIQTINLVQGMNLVGISSIKNISLNSLPSQVIEVSKRNDDGSYQVATKYFSVWFNEFVLEPGKGYWFKLNSDASWSYSP